MARTLLPLVASLLLSRFALAAPAVSASAAASDIAPAPIASVSAAASSPAAAASSGAPAASASAALSSGAPAASASAAASTGVPAASASAAARPSQVPSPVNSVIPPSETAPLASDDPNGVLFPPDADIIPVPQRGATGATVIGPQNVAIDRQNPDLLAPPTTDHGSVMNAKWPFSLSHNRLQTGGWARTQNKDQMPIAQTLAGVDMRLEPGAIRELHWHANSEWAFILKGSVQVTAIDTNGRNFLGNVNPGDLWYFPAGMPHSLQATADSPDGAEFILVFDDGGFDEDDTFLLTDWLSHIPKEVIAKNFQTSISAFDNVPDQQLYIFPGGRQLIIPLVYDPRADPVSCILVPPDDNAQPPASPQGKIPNPFTFPLSQVKATQHSGGTVKTIDETMFKAATGISALEVTVEPGAIRELHWHPNADEWTYFINGTGRVTLFATSGTARTFNYEPGDVGFVPRSWGHYVENTGNSTLHFLEIFNSGLAQDVSLSQWLALTPPSLVQQHLALPQDVLNQLSNFKKKAVVVGPQ
ncbi:RmlC-like cupin domain-containing protein [Daedaleopsis nitida]|nr:RmlC-like cupin domain-containing protein [Daedaleopsis nitida]